MSQLPDTPEQRDINRVLFGPLPIDQAQMEVLTPEQVEQWIQWRPVEKTPEGKGDAS